MSPADLAMIVISALALIVAAISALFAQLGNRTAKSANSTAEKANGIADDALTQAGRANEIAEHANQLSQEANSISKGQELRMTDNSVIDWSPKWDAQSATLTVEHIGRDTATDVTVLIRSQHLTHNHGPVQTVAQGEKLIIPLPKLAQIRNDYLAETVRLAQQSYFRGGFKSEASVVVQWITPTGKVIWGNPIELTLT